MTRINVLSVTLLTDQHLLAEYREITRISSLSRHLDDYGVYKMGEGHVKFFYNKGTWLVRRTNELYQECVARGFNVTPKAYTEHGFGLNNDFAPTMRDIEVNLERLYDKLQTGSYRYYGKAISYEEYRSMVEGAYERRRVVG